MLGISNFTHEGWLERIIPFDMRGGRKLQVEELWTKCSCLSLKIYNATMAF